MRYRVEFPVEFATVEVTVHAPNANAAEEAVMALFPHLNILLIEATPENRNQPPRQPEPRGRPENDR